MFDETVDITNNFITSLSQLNFVTAGGHVYTNGLRLNSTAVGLSQSNCVNHHVKEHYDAFDIGQETIQLGRSYISDNVAKIFTASALVNITSMPVLPNDTGILLFFGFYADFSALNRTPYTAVPVQFIDETFGPTVSSWLWEFGDGHTSTLQNPTHAYVNPGTYTVKLTIQSMNGEFADNVKNSYIATSIAPVSYTYPVTFDGSSTGSPLSSFLWDFGDGTTSTSSLNITHVFDSTGTYDSTLQVFSVTDTSGSVTHPVLVRDTLRADFTGTPLNTSVGAPVGFYHGSTGTYNSFLWNFGDGTTSTDLDTTHVYNSPGSFDISLTVNYTDRTCTTVKNNYITIT